MKYILCLFLCLFAIVAYAADPESTPQTPDVPDITFAQKVPIVVEAKRNPIILDLRIEQDKENVNLAVTVDKDVTRELAKDIANKLVILTKSMTLDDHPEKAGVPGTGLYNYTVVVMRVDQVVLLRGTKSPKKKDLKFDQPMMEDLPPQIRPWTRADEKQ